MAKFSMSHGFTKGVSVDVLYLKIHDTLEYNLDQTGYQWNSSVYGNTPLKDLWNTFFYLRILQCQLAVPRDIALVLQMRYIVTYSPLTPTQMGLTVVTNSHEPSP